MYKNKEYIITMGSGKKYCIDIQNIHDLELLAENDKDYIKEVKLK